MKDDPERMALARPQSRHPMSHVYAIDAPRARNRAMVHGEDHALSLAQGNDLGARLHAGALLGQDKLAAGEVDAWLCEQDRDLQGENMLAVEVLMQAVERKYWYSPLRKP
jgi:hypothetical protein